MRGNEASREERMDFNNMRVNELKLVVAGTNDEALADAICIRKAREALGDRAEGMSDSALMIEALWIYIAEFEAGQHQPN